MAIDTSTMLAIRTVTDPAAAHAALTRRRGFEETTLSPQMREGVRRVFGTDLSAEQVVDRVLADVRDEGDAAVRRYTAAFDGAAPEALEVPRAAWRTALEGLDGELRGALRLSAEQIAVFHRKQVRTSWLDYTDEGVLGQIVRPLDRVGIYTAGGTAV